MADLYTVNKSPFEKNSLESVVKFSTAGSSVLLIEDGVYGATKGTVAESLITDNSELNFYVLASDLKARGISDDRIIDGVKLIDYAEFVDLAVANDKVQAWL